MLMINMNARDTMPRHAEHRLIDMRGDMRGMPARAMQSTQRVRACAALFVITLMPYATPFSHATLLRCLLCPSFLLDTSFYHTY